MLDSFYKSLTIGLQRRWRTGLGQAFGVAGAIWLVTEIAIASSTAATTWLQHHGGLYRSTVIAAAVVWFLVHAYETRSVTFLVPTTDYRITIKYGDLFAEKADWLIGVNEFFDSTLGHVVAQQSLHGQFIAKVYGSDEAAFRAAADAALAGKPSIPTHRPIQPSAQYPIGTTAVVANGAHKAFLMAMSHTDMATAKASSSVPLLWEAMLGGLQAVHNYGNGAALSMPLIGNGRSSVNVEPQHLLRLIVLSLVDFGRKVALPKEVTIVVPAPCFEMLDLREIRRDWMRR
jgi:hypothetical protein